MNWTQQSEAVTICKVGDLLVLRTYKAKKDHYLACVNSFPPVNQVFTTVEDAQAAAEREGQRLLAATVERTRPTPLERPKLTEEMNPNTSVPKSFLPWIVTVLIFLAGIYIIALCILVLKAA